jgi:hypothetical protein
MMWKTLELLERAAPLLLVVIVAVGCPRTRYPVNFANVTDYRIDAKQAVLTPGGVATLGPARDNTAAWRDQVDLQVNQLDQCLRRAGFKPLRRSWFGVFVPDDWYVSPCTGQQLIPSRADYRLCEQKLDPQGRPIVMPVVCRGVVRPTAACPCPCNFRATTQDNFWIVTAPDLRLLKTELARLSTGVNAPWVDARIKGCL